MQLFSIHENKLIYKLIYILTGIVLINRHLNVLNICFYMGAAWNLVCLLSSTFLKRHFMCFNFADNNMCFYVKNECYQ